MITFQPEVKSGVDFQPEQNGGVQFQPEEQTPIISMDQLQNFLRAPTLSQIGQADAVGNQQQTLLGHVVSQLNDTANRAVFTPVVDYLPDNVKAAFNPAYQLAGPNKGQFLPQSQPIALPSSVPSGLPVQNNPADLGGAVGVMKGGLNTLRGLTSPAALLTLPAGGVEEGGGKLLSAILAPQMIPAVSDAATRLGGQYGLPPEQRSSEAIAQALTEGGIGGLFTVLAGLHLASPERPVAPIANQVEQPIPQALRKPNTADTYREQQRQANAIPLGQAEVDPNSPFNRGTLMDLQTSMQKNQVSPTQEPTASSTQTSKVYAQNESPTTSGNPPEKANVSEPVSPQEPRTVMDAEFADVRHGLNNLIKTDENGNKVFDKQAAQSVINYYTETGDVEQAQKMLDRLKAQRKIATPEDLAAYQDATDRMSAALADKQNPDFAAFTKAQQDAENVKNKYGGMPPKGGSNASTVRSDKAVTQTEVSQDDGQVSQRSRSGNLQRNAAEQGKAGQRVLRQASQEKTNKDLQRLLGRKASPESGFVIFPKGFLESLGFGKDKPVSSEQLGNRVRNKLGEKSGTLDFLNGLGFDKFLRANPQISMGQVQQWAKENEPKVEVRKFGEPSSSPETKELGSLQHKFDTLGKDPHDSTIQWTPEQQKDRQRMMELEKVMRDNPSRFAIDRSTQSHWQSIAPKSEQDMPRYVEGAVVKQGNKVGVEKGKELGIPSDTKEIPQFPSSHNFPPNTLGFFRGYMEHRPDGGKTFHVIEVQSDWAQRQREIEQRNKTASDRGTALIKNDSELLLSHYERLALKAAIEHARAEGADRIAVQDFPSTAMTELHDVDALSNGGLFSREDLAADRAFKLNEKSKDKNKYYPFKVGNQWVVTDKLKGDELHYDRTLPKILGELTGDEGKRVTFGEHKMALDNPNYALRENADIRKDLIFRNSDGTPKTDVSAREYSLGKALPESEQTFTGKDKPESSSPVKLSNATKEMNKESGSINGKIIEDLVDKLRNSKFGEFLGDLKNGPIKNLVLRGAGEPLPEHAKLDKEASQAGYMLAQAHAIGSKLKEIDIPQVLGDSKLPNWDGWVGAGWVESQLRQKRDDLVKAGETDKANAVETLVGNGRSILKNEQEYQTLLKDPQFQAVNRRFNSIIAPETEARHVELGGKLLPKAKDTGVFINTPPKEQPTNTPTTGPRGAIVRKTAFGQERTGTGTSYETSATKIMSRMIDGNLRRKYLKDYFKTLESKGLAGKAVKGVAPDFSGLGAHRVSQDVVRLLHLDEHGKVQDVNTVLHDWFIHPKLKNEFENISRMSSNGANEWLHKLSTGLTSVQVEAGVDAAAHISNLVGSLNSVARQHGLGDLIGGREADTFTRLMRNIIDNATQPDKLQAIEREMALKGIARDYGDVKGLAGKYSPGARAIQYVDRQARIAFYQLGKELQGKGAMAKGDVELRRFVDKMVGQYNTRFMSPTGEAIRAVASNFMVAGKTFNRVALGRLTQNPGFNATSVLRGRGAQLIYTITALGALPALINYKNSGSVFGPSGTKFGEIYLGKDDKGNNKYLDMAKLTFARRGMQITGLQDLAEQQVMPRLKGEKTVPVGSTLKDMTMDTAKGVARPYMGPLPSTVSRLAMGGSLGFDNRKAGETKAPYFAAAARNLNPLVGAAMSGFDEGGLPNAKSAIQKTFEGMIGVRRASDTGVVRNLAKAFTVASGKDSGEGGSYAPSPYLPLVNALRQGDVNNIKSQYQKVIALEGGGDGAASKLDTYFNRYATRPYTWSKEGDDAFYDQLKPAQQALYDKARQEDDDVAEKYFDLLSDSNRKRPNPRRR